MPGAGDDLQQWLEALKRKAEAQARGVADGTHDRADVPEKGEKGRASSRKDRRPGQAEAERARWGPRQERQRREEEQRETEQRQQEADERARQEQREKGADARRRRNIAEAGRRRADAKRGAGTARNARTRQRRGTLRPAPRSSLGLSGDLIHDLRRNPATLREAILLLEILGPPLADRDPMDRFV